MASYRPFPPNHNSLPPPPPLAPVPQARGNQYSQNWGYPNPGFQQAGYAIPPPNQPQQQFTSYPPPPPPLESTYPPPPPPVAPPGQMHFPSSQYQQPPLQPPPPPPPPSSPPSSSVPPPPPPSPPLPPPPSSATITKENKQDGYKRPSNDPESSKWPSRQHSKPSNLPPVPTRKSNGPLGRVETEDERRLRKKKEMEKQKQEEKHRQQLKESQSKILNKTQMLATKPHGSVTGSHMGDRRATSFLSGERIENRLKKPTTFLCKLK